MFKARASVLILATLAPASLGQATYISQDRWISVIDCNASPPQIIAAPDFGLFDEVMYSSYTSSSAEQTSTLQPWFIKATGNGRGRKQNGCCGAGKSHCSVVFDIVEPTAWTLKGYIYVACNGDAFWKLGGPGVNLVFKKQFPEVGFVQLDESGILDVGTYEVAVEAGSGCSGYPGGGCVASFDFDFAFGNFCDPDCDGSGSLDVDDFICFQTLYAIGDPKADCDGDGQLLIDDFICFQTLYAIGC